MTLFAVRLLLGRVPLIAWLILTLTLATVGALAAANHHGAVMQHRTDVAAARHDSVETRITAVDTATLHAAHAIERFRTARTQSDSGRAIARRLSDRAAAELSAAPLVIRELVAAQDSTIRRDSLTIRAGQAAVDSLIRERFARIALDTMRVHAQDDPTSASGAHAARVVAITAAIAGALALLLHMAR